MTQNSDGLFELDDMEALERAQLKLKESLGWEPTEPNRESAILRFLLTYEQAWKAMKRYVEAQSRETYAIKEIFREATKAGLISDPIAWEPYIKIRNVLIHTYNELMAKEVYEQLPRFAELAGELVINLKSKIEG